MVTSTSRYHSVYTAGEELFFLVTASACLLGTGCLLVSCLLSISTASIISKTIFVSFPGNIFIFFTIPSQLFVFLFVWKHYSHSFCARASQDQNRVMFKIARTLTTACLRNAVVVFARASTPKNINSRHVHQFDSTGNPLWSRDLWSVTFQLYRSWGVLNFLMRRLPLTDKRISPRRVWENATFIHEGEVIESSV